ncbi:pimeloyl-ACP methyl ester carboxylesterase [Nocardioides thalensis]|uniref:Pimeloyl-ACP methyl ester carboxylesterase n=1 Tax=Nocardioides thalensis TaxID=1914755 RepID=A0A853BZ14_9ACTN|nr:alpha/beta hydrolase [Nocardioides thalensis]NYI99382.1 pimeloyl-ACP methyl ester carboxylesterase [Nocardioides thalensis]
MKKLVVAVVVIWSLVLVAGAGVAITAIVQAGDDDEEPTRAETSGAPSSPSDSGAPEKAPAGLEDFYSQEIAWESCGANECGTLEVPVSYQEPEGATIELALERTLATGDRIGSLVVNPGGPGAPGTSVPESSEFYFAPDVLERYDVVGFDPRGTGDSAPIDCLSDSELDDYVAEDPGPDNKSEERRYAKIQLDYWQGCADNTGEILGHVSTIEAARDMDVLRAVLGEQQLAYFGWSYGTRLGSTYADLFPEKVGRFVLDGATDPGLSSYESTLSQAEGFEVALRSYVQDCVDKGDCFLGDSVDEGLTTITDLLDSIEQEPLPTDQERDLEIGNAVYGVITPLYNQEYWTILDEALQMALDGDGSTLLRLSDAYGSRENGEYTANSLESISVINCLDNPEAVPPEEVPSHYDEFQKASPTFGRIFAWFLIACDGIPVERTEPDIEIDAPGAAPIVVIGTTRDPATPYHEAVAMAKALESGVLLSRDGDGHTGYNQGNACIDDAVHAYLIDGTVPQDGLEC